MSPGLSARVNKAFRVRGDRVRWIYFTARRLERFGRDRRRREQLQHLPPTALEIPADRGFLILPPGWCAEGPDVVASAWDALRRFNAAEPVATKSQKRFLVNVLDTRTLTLESPLMQLALRPDVLSAVSRYLRVVPFLTAISVFHSDAVKGQPKSSQLHHCDGDDVRQLKLFVYCADVDARSGPLTVVSAAESAYVRRRTGYQYRQRLRDEDLRAILGDAAEQPILGPAGTMAFVDTSRCFHFGSRVEAGAPPRLAVMIQYQTPYSFMVPTAAQSSLPFRHLIDSSLDPLQRMVLGE